MPRFRVRRVLKAGEYEVKVVDAKAGTSKAGNEKITLRVSAGENIRWITHDLTFTDNAMDRVGECLQALGEDAADDRNVEAGPLIGLTGRALIGVRDYQGREQNYIEKWLPPISTAVNDGERATVAQTSSDLMP